MKKFVNFKHFLDSYASYHSEKHYILLYHKLKDLFPKKLQDGIDYIFAKNGTIYIALHHPIYINEFKYQKEFIIEWANKISNLHNLKQVENVKFFVSNNLLKESAESTEKTIELADGNFKNKIENQDLHNIMEDIRIIICQKKS